MTASTNRRTPHAPITRREALLPPLEPTSIVRVEGTARRVKAYSLLEEELESMARGYTSINQMFLGVCLGALVALLITVTTVDLAPTARLAYIWASAGALLLTLYFGIGVVLDVRAANQRLTRLKRDAGLLP